MNWFKESQVSAAPQMDVNIDFEIQQVQSKIQQYEVTVRTLQDQIKTINNFMSTPPNPADPTDSQKRAVFGTLINLYNNEMSNRNTLISNLQNQLRTLQSVRVNITQRNNQMAVLQKLNPRMTNLFNPEYWSNPFAAMRDASFGYSASS